jgi:endonuclease YncB( thermonuclease family)
MIRTITAALAALIVASIPSAFADDLAGRASVIDGDTLDIHGTRIRLWGIDAPESSQLCRGDDSLQYRCGAKAANDLDAFIASRPVSCIPISLDRYRRTVATCSVGGVDIGEWLVRNGLALDWPQYSKGKFDSVQREAVHAAACGRAATSSHGYIGSASGRAEARATAQTTRTRTHSSSRPRPMPFVTTGIWLIPATPTVPE